MCNNNSKKFAGFTLIELLVTITIGSILAGATVYQTKNYIAESKEAKATAEQAQACTKSVADCVKSETNDCPSYDSCIVGNEEFIPATLEEITDVAFQNVILSKLGIATWSEVTISDLNNMTGGLNCGNKGIVNFSGVGNLTGLTAGIMLFNSNLTSIPPGVLILSNISILWLHGNNLTSVPSSIGNMHNLSYLRLEWNNITSLPTEISNLTNLTRLYLTGNLNLSTIPSAPPGNNTLVRRTSTQLTCADVLAAGWNSCE